MIIEDCLELWEEWHQAVLESLLSYYKIGYFELATSGCHLSHMVKKCSTLKNEIIFAIMQKLMFSNVFISTKVGLEVKNKAVEQIVDADLQKNIIQPQVCKAGT